MAAPIRKLAKPLARHLASDLDLSIEALTAALDLSAHIKRTPARFAKTLSGRYLALLFEKPSLRTRLTFELAIKQLGGDAVASMGPVGDREPVKDVARNLDRWTHGIVARVFSQTTIDATVSLPWIVEMSKHSIRRGSACRPRTACNISSASYWAAVV